MKGVYGNDLGGKSCQDDKYRLFFGMIYLVSGLADNMLWKTDLFCSGEGRVEHFAYLLS